MAKVKKILNLNSLWKNKLGKISKENSFVHFAADKSVNTFSSAISGGITIGSSVSYNQLQNRPMRFEMIFDRLLLFRGNNSFLNDSFRIPKHDFDTSDDLSTDQNWGVIVHSWKVCDVSWFYSRFQRGLATLPWVGDTLSSLAWAAETSADITYSLL